MEVKNIAHTQSTAPVASEIPQRKGRATPQIDRHIETALHGLLVEGGR